METNFNESRIEYKELVQTDIKQGAIRDFALRANGNFIALLSTHTELMTLELITKPSLLVKWPYKCITWPITKSRPLEKLINGIDLRDLYFAYTNMERQEFSLEPVYIDAAIPIKAPPKPIHVAWSPQTLSNGEPLMGVLTNYGAFMLLSKDLFSRNWNREVRNLNELINLYDTKLLPKYEKKSLEKFINFKKAIGRYWITTFTFDECSNAQMIFAGNDLGYILMLKFDRDALNLLKYNCTVTDMGRLVYMLKKNDLMLVCNIEGVVKIFKIDSEGTAHFVDCLWSKKDRCCIQEATITYCNLKQLYLIVFSKSAHAICFCLGIDGKMLSSGTLYLGGLKITGLAMHNTFECLFSTIVSVVYHLKVSVNNDQTLELEKTIVPVDFDAENYQILGMSNSVHKNFVNFLIFRAKEFPTATSYQSRLAAKLSMGKLNSINALEVLTSQEIHNILDYADFLCVIRLEIFNDLDISKYIDYATLTAEQFQEDTQIDNKLLQCLQVKYLVVEAILELLNEKEKQSLVPDWCRFAYIFLKCAIQIVHIHCRLHYLKMCEGNLTDFQRQSTRAMREAHFNLIMELQNLLEVQSQLETQEDAEILKEIMPSDLVETIKCFIRLMEMPGDPQIEEFSKCTPQDSLFTKTCSVSYVAYEPGLEQRYCAECGRNALLDESLLRQLFSENEAIKCTICRACFIYENNEL